MKWHRYRFVNLVVVLSALAFLFGGGALSVRATVTDVTLANPGPGTYGEDDDYFTTVWGNPRDMDEKLDLYVLNSTCATVTTANWESTSVSGGIWSGTTGSIAGGSRYLWVLNPGWESSLDTGEDGQVRPVDASRYAQLTFRMYSSQGGGTAEVGYTKGEISHPPYSNRFTVFQGWNIYTLDFQNPNWAGSITGIVFQFHDLPPGIEIKLDWVRLTPKQNRQIAWTIVAPSGNVAVYLSSDPTFGDPESYSRLRIYEGSLQETPASAGSLTLPASFPGGMYYVRVVDERGGAISSGAWVFQEVPIAEIVAPSYISGEDFATSVVGNPWDMNSTDDIDRDSTEGDPDQVGMSYSATDGILTVSPDDDGVDDDCSAPWPHRPLGLNLGGHQIDTSKYKYFSYRYKVDQAPDQGPGGMMRVRWQLRTGYWPTGRTDDISLYDNGWHTYHLDLSTVSLEAEEGQWVDFAPNVMQIMVNEAHRAWTSHLDWVKLTAENTALMSYTVRWNLVNVSSVLTSTIYWATGRDSSTVLGSGYVVPSGETGIGPTPPYTHTLFLPLVLRGYNPASVTQFQYEIGTDGLVSGREYYIAIKLEDGYNVAWWYSELPVRKL